jgi:hypothetical protein
MPGFYFRAPTLLEPSATPSDDMRDILHDAKGMADILAKSGKFAAWLETAMGARGLRVKGPFIDESGWMLEVKSEAGFVVCNVSSGARADDSLFYMLVSRFSGATERVGEIVEALLKNAPEIVDLEVERD